MREAGAAQTTSQAVVGHNSAEIHELYSHTDNEAKRLAVYALPSFTGDKSAELADPLSPRVEAAPIRKLVKKLSTQNVQKIKSELLEMLT